VFFVPGKCFGKKMAVFRGKNRTFPRKIAIFRGKTDVTISVRHGRHGRHGRQINFWGRAFGRRLTTENFR